jgi:hypothetical protein
MTTHLFRLVSIFSAVAALWVASNPSDCQAQALDPRFGLETNAGKGAGWGTGFSSFDWFQPVTATQNDITFLNWSANVDWDAMLSNNLGFGYRMYNAKADRMFGFYGFYDVRDSGRAVYHQASAGFETVGPNWILRSNMYIPIKPPERLIEASPFSDPFFQSNFISQSRTAVFQTALPGADIELGVPLPVSFGATMYGGLYGYVPTVGEMAPGWRTRLEARLTDNVLANVSVQDDRLFGLTANFGLAWYWRGWRPTLGFGGKDVCCGTGYQRMATPVWRQKQVAVHDRVANEVRNLTQINCITQEIEDVFVIHVDNSATGSQNLGTFEDPLTSLGQVSAFSDLGDIIFVHGNPNDTTGQNRGVTLLGGQRLLAGGFQHFVSTIELGNILLPGYDPSLRGQTITNITATSDVINLAGDDIEVSGFTILNSRASGIANNPQGGQISGVFSPADNCFGISINRNTIVDQTVPNNTGAGIFLTDAFGVIRIGDQDPRAVGNADPELGDPNAWGNLITGHPNGGIIINRITGASVTPGIGNTTTAIIANNVIRNNGFGPLFPSDDEDPVLASNNGITIIAMNADDENPFTSRVDVLIENNVIVNNGLFEVPSLDNPFIENNNGIHLLVSDLGVINADILDNNRVDNGSQAGNPFNPLFDGTPTGLAGISGNDNNGIFMGVEAPNVTTAVGVINARIDNNIINFNGTAFDTTVRGDGIRGEITADAPGQILLTRGGGVTSNDISFNARNGIFMHAVGQGNAAQTPQINLNASDNTIDDNGTVFGVVGVAPEGSGIALLGEDAATISLVASDNISISRNFVHGVFGQVLDDNSTLSINVSGTGAIDDNGTFNGVVAVGDGIRAQAEDAAQLALLVTDNDSISGNFNNGVFVQALDSVVVVATIDGNTINNNGNSGAGGDVLGGNRGNNNGVFFHAGDDVRATVQVTSNNSIDDNGFVTNVGNRLGDGVSIHSTDDALFTLLQVDGNDSISNNIRSGVNIGLNTGNVTGQQVSVSNNLVIDGNGGLNGVGAPIGAGVQVVTTDGAVLAQLDINGNGSISDNGQRGVFVSLTTDNGSAQRVSISDNGPIDDNGRNGLANGVLDPSGAPVGGVIVQGNGSVVFADLSINRNDSISNNAEYGVSVEINSDQATDQNVFINDNEVVDNNGSINGQGTPVGDGVRVRTTGNTVLQQLQINDSIGAASTSISNNSRHGVFVDLNSASGGVANGQNVSISGHANIDENGGLNAGGTPTGDGIRVTTTLATVLNSLNINNNASIGGAPHPPTPGLPGGNANNGVFVSLNSTSGALQTVSISNNGDISNNGTVTPVTAIGDGVHFEANLNSNVRLGIVNNDTISNNAANGVFVQSTGTAVITSRIAENLIEDNGTAFPLLLPPTAIGNGIFVAARGTSTINMDGQTGLITQPNDRLESNVINRNTVHGIQAIKETAANLRISVANNVATANGGNGIFIDSQGGAAGSFRGLVVGNNVTNPSPPAAADGASFNGQNGIRVIVNSNGNGADPLTNPDLLIDSNTAQSNGQHGIHVSVGGNTNSVVITNNTADMNTLNGLQVDNTGAGNQFVIANNTTTFDANGLNGIAINNGTTGSPLTGVNAVWTITGNTATNNGTVASRAALLPPLAPLPANTGDGNGLLINNRSPGATYTIEDNTFTDNFRWGIRINNILGADNANFTVQNNTLTDNGDTVTQDGGGLNINNGAINATYDVDGNTVQDNTGHGVLVNSTVNTALLAVNNMEDVSGNGLDGIAVRVTGGTVTNLQINGNQGISGNGAAALPAGTDGNGISLTINGGIVQNWEISDNGTTDPLAGNARDGIRVTLTSGGNNAGAGVGGGVINGNVIGDNGSAALGGNGITVLNNSASNVVNITSNTVSDVTSGFAGGGGSGIVYQASTAAVATTARINNNGIGGDPIDGNARNGILVDVAANGVQLLEVNGNVVSNNGTGAGTFAGIQVNLSGSGMIGPGVTIGGNTSADNDGHGIGLSVTGGTNLINVNNGNTLQGNAGNGLAATITGSGNQLLVNGNTFGGSTTALGNDGHGLSVVVGPGTAASNTINIGGLAGNQFNNNGLNGIDLTKSSTGATNLFQVVGNTITSNGQSGTGHGVAFRTTAGATGATTFEVNGSNTITGNQGDGVNGVIATSGNTVRIQSNDISDSDDNGVNLSIATGTTGNAYSVSSNTVTDNGADGTGNGILLSVGGSNNIGTDVNDNTVTGNATGGTSGSGIVFTLLAGGSGNNVTMLRNTVSNNLDHGLLASLAAANSTLTFNDSLGVSGNGTGGLGHGLFITSTGASNTVTLLGNTITGNNDDGINYVASGATGNRLFISDNPIPPAPLVTGSTISGNGDDGIELTITGGSTVSAQVVGNTFIAANADSQFVATTAAAAGNALSLQFLKNQVGTPGAGTSDDYIFTRGAGSTFQFENPFVLTDNAAFDEFTGVIGLGTNLSGNNGTFLFTGFDGSEDVAVGTFFTDPIAPY